MPHCLDRGKVVSSLFSLCDSCTGARRVAEAVEREGVKMRRALAEQTETLRRDAEEQALGDEIREWEAARSNARKKVPPAPADADDVVTALVNLGYDTQRARAAVVASSQQLGPAATFELVLRDALKLLRR